jgi:hypothetical protein
MRELTIIGGFLLATLTAAVLVFVTPVLFYAPSSNMSQVELGRAFDSVALMDLARAFTFFWVAIIVGAMLPASLAIVHAETRHIHSAWFYIVAGAGTAIALWGCVIGFLVHVMMHDPGPAKPVTIGALLLVALSFLIAAAYGFAAGWVYWAVAGRTAGYPVQESVVPSR